MIMRLLSFNFYFITVWVSFAVVVVATLVFVVVSLVVIVAAIVVIRTLRTITAFLVYTTEKFNIAEAPFKFLPGIICPKDKGDLSPFHRECKKAS